MRKWLYRLLGHPVPEEIKEREADQKALKELHNAFDKVQNRTTRLERELLRVNAELRRHGQPR